MIILTNFRNFYKTHGKSIGAGCLCKNKLGVFVLVSKFYNNQTRFTSSSSSALVTRIKPIINLNIIQKNLLYLSCNKNLYENYLLKQKDIYARSDLYLDRYFPKFTRDTIIMLKRELNKRLNEHMLPGISSKDHPYNQYVPIKLVPDFFEQEPIVVLSVLEYRIRKYMYKENEIIKEIVEKLTLKHEHILFVTKITAKTVLSDLTKADLVFECLKRNLIKKDEKKPVYLLDNNNEELKIGDSIYSFKFTPLFMALYDKLYNKEDLKELSSEKVPAEKTLNFGLIALPIRYINNTFMPTGAHNHINVAIYIDDLKHKVLAFGFLTTQKIGLKLAEYQFDIFQQKVSAGSKDDFKFPPNLLPQRFLPFKNMREFTIDSIKILKNGTEYIQQVSDLAVLYDSIKKLKIKPIHKGVDGRGISLEEMFEVCKAFDYNNENKIPQPKTYTQIQQDEKNKIAMALKALKKNEETLLNTTIYENEII